MTFLPKESPKTSNVMTHDSKLNVIKSNKAFLTYKYLNKHSKRRELELKNNLNLPKSKDSLHLERIRSLCDLFGSGLQPCAYEWVNGSAMAECGWVCSHCVHKWKGGLPTVCVNILFVGGCACVEQRHCASAQSGGEGGCYGCMQYGKGGMDINHQEEHGSVAPGGDGWGVSAVMSPWQMDRPCWLTLAHRLSFQLVPHTTNRLTYNLQVTHIQTHTHTLWPQIHPLLCPNP